MADREDSIHIKIKIDVDPQDKEFVENLSADIARADKQQVTKKQAKQETIPADEKTEQEIKSP